MSVETVTDPIIQSWLAPDEQQPCDGEWIIKGRCTKPAQWRVYVKFTCGRPSQAQVLCTGCKDALAEGTWRCRAHKELGHLYAGYVEPLRRT